MASRFPERGRPKAQGNRKKIILRKWTNSTFGIARKSEVGIVRRTHSQFVEMLLLKNTCTKLYKSNHLHLQELLNSNHVGDLYINVSCWPDAIKPTAFIF